MQSSRMNSAPARLSAASHSRSDRRSGELGVLPTRARCSVAVDKAEAAERGFRLAFAAAAEDQARRRADATRQQEADAERSDRDGRQVRAQLAGDVGGLADALAQRLGSVRQLLALGLDLAANVRDGT